MTLGLIFEEYRRLLSMADASFLRVSRQFSTEVRCSPGCSDCCHAAFGLFFIEAVYLRMAFQQLDRKHRRAVLSRAEKADKELDRIRNAKVSQGVEKGFDLSSVRIRCPLLSEDVRCLLYDSRPVTCRVYGIPTSANGKIMVCPRSGFRGQSDLPAFDIGAAHRALYRMSLALPGLGPDASQKAMLLLTVSKALSTPLEALLTGRL